MYAVTQSENDEPVMHMIAGKTYIMDACNAGVQLLRNRPANAYQVDPKDIAQGNDGILIIRAGGMGDILQCAALIRALHKLHPDNPIDFCCAAMFAEAIRFHPRIRSVKPYPFDIEEARKYSQIITLENAVEFNRTDHMADAFLIAGGIDPATVKDKSPAYYPPKVKVETTPRGKKPRVGIQDRSSAPCRTSSKIGDYCAAFLKAGWEVYLFGGPGKSECDIEGVVNMTGNLELHETAAWMQTCDAMLTQDSGLLHLAAALRIPTVALFSVIDADLRVRYSPYVIGINAKSGCAPCFWHGRGGPFPPQCPTAHKGVCGPLDGIPFPLIMNCVEKVTTAKKQANKRKGKR
jgi:ADP-heptose:LPS heptosyltransferase